MRPWQDISTAPQDGTTIEARGHDLGDKSLPKHKAFVHWNGNNWVDSDDEPTIYLYLEEWREQ